MKSALGALAFGLALLPALQAQQVSFTDGTSNLNFFTGTQTRSIKGQGTAAPTGPYTEVATRITITGANNENEVTTFTFTDFGTPVTPTGTPNSTQSTTTARPTNTQACNNHVELCTKKYSNITNIGAHNSPFVRPGNSGSNQELDVTHQLNDGIRFLQAQIQYPDNSTVPHFCHTTCDLLDAGPITKWLTEVRKWVDNHPYDVVTILLGNGNYSEPSAYAGYIESTGIVKYAYEAPVSPMTLDDWPTLEYLILRGKRVVMFMDYMANQTAYPWLLDEFSAMSETPFNPTNRDFPCTIQRPPDRKDSTVRDRLYLMNHNLAAEFNVFGADLLVPAVSLLNETNADEGYGSLGLSANNCRSDWGRAPNVLNVDYYNYGNFPGSVFQVAADMNNVTYDKDCCGKVSAAAMAGPVGGLLWTVVGLVAWMALS
ncbi:PLC-like phosphodiesterase [Sarocladium strictum]